MITFDDGCRDFAVHGWPALRARGFPATMFVVAGEVGTTNRWDRPRGEPERPLLDWDEIRRMGDEGLEVGSHTLTHPDLSATPDAEALTELRESRTLLEDRLQRRVEFLAYPFGRFTSRTEEIARAAGYRGACAVLLRLRDLGRSERFTLRRLTVKRQDGPLRFPLRLRIARSVAHRIEGRGPVGRGSALRQPEAGG